ncbi:uncharacterized protein IUM83_16658 [Phytophthora cinnamomi]|uniref:uncharacterized protein n=1 Tax=Phytophthora cinnamomi TaxID=4785 RepID=UPI002A30C5C6|nr:hypothetical protein IUM83_16658 [Phytophthora cinnamomi]KAJ8569392.1 hypothetical protein ON010_g5868 [Phytophthora cinnamomi]
MPAATTTNSNSPATATQLPPDSNGSKRKTEPMSAGANGEPAAKRPYYGKCQYKTGKCFNERTLKRNGDAHSLCEEHRIKQNLIQRRSDRKYQKVHAIRRRERSQRRAALKKQVSMAVAQQFFIEQQQQKNFGASLLQYHDPHMFATASNNATLAQFAAEAVGLTPPQIRVPPAFTLGDQTSIGSPLVLSCSKMGATAPVAIAAAKDKPSPVGIDDFTPYSFSNVPMFPDSHTIPAIQCDEREAGSRVGDSIGFMPIASCPDRKETWSDADIEFLQNILLA